MLRSLQEDKGIYVDRVKTMIEDRKTRLIVDINDLRKKNPQRAARLDIHFN